jgi:hypothetical protein
MLIPWQCRLKLTAAELAFAAARLAIGTGGGLREGPWIPLVQAESPRRDRKGAVIAHTDGAGGGPIGRDIIAAMARSYDPKIHMAPIIANEGRGNPHLTAEEDPPAGGILRLVATPTHLWGKPVEIVDEEDGKSRLEKWIAHGWTHRSVFVWDRFDLPEGPYLRHVALSGGFPEGQGGNPPMSWYYPQALKLVAPTAERLATLDASGLIRLSDTTGDAPEEEETMDPKEIAAMMQDAIAGAMTSVMEKIGALGTETQAALAANTEAVNTRLSTFESNLTALQTRIEEGAAGSEKAQLRARLELLEGQGRLAPALLEEELGDLLEMSATRREAKFARLAAQPPINKASQLLSLPDTVDLKAPKPSKERLSEAGLDLQEGIPAEVVGFARLKAMDEAEKAKGQGVRA